MGKKLNPKTGKWEAWYVARHPETRQPVSRRKTGLKNEREAARAEKALMKQVLELFSEHRSPKWQASVDEFLEDCRQRNLTEHTIHDYRSSLVKYTFEPWASKRIDQVSTADIQELMRGPIRQRSQWQQKNVLKFIRGVMKFGVQRGYIQRDPTPQMKFKTGKKLKKVLTEEQARTLLTQARDMDVDWYPIWAMALYTGMRNGELFALTWDKVNLNDRLILVNCAWNSRDGFKSTKSENDRLIEIAPPLIPILKELKISSDGSPFVLPRVKGWEKGEQARELRMFLAGMGLPEIRFHDLRATWATILLQKGVEPIKVMISGGWESMKTMMIYVRKAGVDIKGMTDGFEIHDPVKPQGKMIKLFDTRD